MASVEPSSALAVHKYPTFTPHKYNKDSVLFVHCAITYTYTENSVLE